MEWVNPLTHTKPADNVLGTSTNAPILMKMSQTITEPK